jgi:tail lysozyme
MSFFVTNLFKPTSPAMTVRASPYDQISPFVASQNWQQVLQLLVAMSEINRLAALSQLAQENPSAFQSLSGAVQDAGRGRRARQVQADMMSTDPTFQQAPPGGPQGPTSPTDASNLTGNNNAQKALNYFMGKGLTREQAAGIVGNLMQESRINPNDTTGDGGRSHGIAQWNGQRLSNLKQFAASQGKPWNDLGVQLDFMWHEMTGPKGVMGGSNESRALAALKSARTPAEAAVRFEQAYERAGAPNNAARARFAEQAANMGPTVA